MVGRSLTPFAPDGVGSQGESDDDMDEEENLMDTDENEAAR